MWKAITEAQEIERWFAPRMTVRALLRLVDTKGGWASCFLRLKHALERHGKVAELAPQPFDIALRGEYHLTGFLPGLNGSKRGLGNRERLENRAGAAVSDLDGEPRTTGGLNG